MKNVKKLIIGSAGKKHPDAITLDIDPEHHPDVVHNIETSPWPFEDNAFQKIVAHHILEHVSQLSVVMSEMHRVCAQDGEIHIEVPHHTSWMAYDPAHLTYFNYFSLDSYLHNKDTWVHGRKFACLNQELTFHRFFRSCGLQKIFNRWPLMYERFFCYRCPAEHIKFVLRPHHTKSIN
ncbi:MAG: class I SAM-dependent methyltransferase [Candidatus Omnitrophica bacterium]|nr:class I SAM-dependent methyltransferase [Candidatus Omnitrophota bacterium]